MAIDLAAAQTEAIALLNGQDLSTLAFWDATDLAGYCDKLAQELARSHRLIAQARRDIAIDGGVAVYSWPTKHVGTVQVSAGDKVLREASISELEALSPDWTTETAAAPSHWVGNWQGVQTFRMYPSPNDDGEWSVIDIEYPDQVTPGNLTVDFPSVLGELFVLQMAYKALRAETRGARPETAQMIEQMMKPIQDLIGLYWGK